jgi:hypothetical protein
VEAPLAVSVVLLPVHIEGAEGLIVTTGKGLTVTVTVAVLVQPAALVPVTVYVVVAVGDAVTVVPVVELKPVEGVQLYVEAPLAVRFVLCPVHIATGLGVMVTVG